MDNIKESDIKYFLKNANKKQKEKFNKLYGRVTKYKKQYGGTGINKINGNECYNPNRPTKVITIIWVRHCESCSNKWREAGKCIKYGLMSKFRQPLCTQFGTEQCVRFGQNLPNNHSYKFYSSLLPRAMLTSKLISSQMNGIQYIQPLPYISEQTHSYNRTSKLWPRNKRQSQSSSIPGILIDYIHKLNKSFIGPDIKIINNNTVDGPLNNNQIYNDKIYTIKCLDSNFEIDVAEDEYVTWRPDDWENFKTHILPNLSTTDTNIIVAHGGIIRDNVLIDCMSSQSIHDNSIRAETTIETPNLQSYRIQYKCE